MARLASGIDDRIAVLLDRTDAAVDRGQWADVESLTTEILALQPSHAEALGLLAYVKRRMAQANEVVDTGFESERRTVTVVFSDLANSSKMAERLDPEEMREILSWYQRIVGETVTEAGGFVARFMGDGALIYFGYPRSTEEAPRQAVHAALAIVSKMKARRSDNLKSYGVEVDARVGIHTGLAVIAEMGGGNRQEVADIIGETPNIAARLEGLAQAGTVLISGESHRLVTGYFEVVPRGAQQLRNISRPIEAYQIIRATGATSRLEASDAASRTPMIGRREEHQALQKARDQVIAGEGRIMLVSGEAGVGKSRLMEAAALGMTAGWPVQRAGCTPHTQSTPFHPLRSLLCADGEETLHTALGVDPKTFNSAASERDALLGAAVNKLLGGAKDGPALLIFEDIHWADPSTLELLGLLAERIDEGPLLLIATLRPEIQPPWFDHANVARIPLRPLSHEDVSDMVAHMLAAPAAPPGIVDWLVERTGGVPLFVEELIRSLREAGKLKQALSGTDEFHADIPLTLQGVLLGRLDRLGPAKRVAQVASVIGREFDVGLLKRVIDLDQARLLRDLNDLLDSGLVEPSPAPERLIFKHALICDAAYKSILHTTTRTTHAAIADALLVHDHEILDRSPEVVASHLFEAQRYDQAATLFAEAARIASTRFAHSEAISHLTMALKATMELPDGETRRGRELRLRLQLGPSLIAARGYGAEDVADNYRRARLLCADAADSRQLFDTVRGLTVYYLLTEQLEEASELAETSLGIGTRRSDDDELLEASAWLGTTRFFQGEASEAASLLDYAIQHYDPDVHGQHAVTYGIDPAILAMSHRSWLHWLNGEVTAALAARDDMVTLADTLGHPLSRAHTLNYATGLAVFLGDFERAQSTVREQIELARAVKTPHYEAYGEILLGRSMVREDPNAAIALISTGLQRRKTTGALLALPLHHGLLAEAHLAAGDLTAAGLEVSSGLEIAQRAGESWWLPELYRLSAVIGHQKGKDDIEPALRTAHRLAMKTGARTLATRAALSAAHILPALSPDDPLHLNQHRDLIDGDSPEQSELKQML